MNPELHALQVPVVSAHWMQPGWHTPQSPVDVRKNPGAHPEHFVPSLLSTQASLHEQLPSGLHTPLTQLHFLGSVSSTLEERQRPLPEIPSSHLSHPSGHVWHWGPKKPAAHDSQEDPAKLEGQTHWPAAEHTPAPAHAGEQVVDWTSRRLRDGAKEI
jgi:hypothetical protein